MNGKLVFILKVMMLIRDIVLLREPWNPLTEQIVPELSIADFGISSRVRTLNTRLTTQRGTPGYEAPVSKNGDDTTKAIR